MPVVLFLVGLINLVAGVPANLTLTSFNAYGKYVLVSFAFFGLAELIDEKRKQTKLLAEISSKLSRTHEKE